MHVNVFSHLFCFWFFFYCAIRGCKPYKPAVKYTYFLHKFVIWSWFGRACVCAFTFNRNINTVITRPIDKIFHLEECIDDRNDICASNCHSTNLSTPARTLIQFISLFICVRSSTHCLLKEHLWANDEHKHKCEQSHSRYIWVDVFVMKTKQPKKKKQTNTTSRNSLQSRCLPACHWQKYRLCGPGEFRKQYLFIIIMIVCVVRVCGGIRVPNISTGE